MCDAMECGDRAPLYVIGENPAQSEADQGAHARLLEGLEFLVVQDLFLTKTARAGGRGPARRRGLGGVRGNGHQLRAARPARAQGDRAARRSARRPVDHHRARAPDGQRLGLVRGRGRLERAADPVADARRDELRAARSAGWHPVAVLRREPPRRAVPPLAPVGGPGPGDRVRRSWPSSTIRRSTASTTSSRSG